MAVITIQNWDGSPVLGVKSTGSAVFAALDWRNLILGSPGPPIEQKARHPDPRSLKAFEEGDARELKKLLGHYTQLQSINSEDTVTWSVFSHQEALTIVYQLALAACLHPPVSGSIVGAFWERAAHPDTKLINQGPEADLVIRGAGCHYAVEAKWKADIDDRQGRDRDKTQIDMRCSSVRAANASGDARGVLIVAPAPNRYPPASRPKSCFRRYFTPVGDGYHPTPLATSSEARAITWERIYDRLASEPSLTAVRKYLGWRLEDLETG